MITGLVVLKMVLMPSRHFLVSLANSGPRWSMMGVSIARNTRSGSGVGPGMCRKWRPTGREEFLVISKSLQRLRNRTIGRGHAKRERGPRAAAFKAEWRGEAS